MKKSHFRSSVIQLHQISNLFLLILECWRENGFSKIPILEMPSTHTEGKLCSRLHWELAAASLEWMLCEVTAVFCLLLTPVPRRAKDSINVYWINSWRSQPYTASHQNLSSAVFLSPSLLGKPHPITRPGVCSGRTPYGDGSSQSNSSFKTQFSPEIKVKVKVAQSCPTPWNPMACSPVGFSVHGILQVEIEEWIAVPSSRGSSQPRDQTQASCIAGRFFTLWATRPVLSYRHSKSSLMAPDLASSHSVGLLWFLRYSCSLSPGCPVLCIDLGHLGAPSPPHPYQHLLLCRKSVRG